MIRPHLGAALIALSILSGCQSPGPTGPGVAYPVGHQDDATIKREQAIKGGLEALARLDRLEQQQRDLETELLKLAAKEPFPIAAPTPKSDSWIDPEPVLTESLSEARNGTKTFTRTKSQAGGMWDFSERTEFTFHTSGTKQPVALQWFAQSSTESSIAHEAYTKVWTNNDASATVQIDWSNPGVADGYKKRILESGQRDASGHWASQGTVTWGYPSNMISSMVLQRSKSAEGGKAELVDAGQRLRLTATYGSDGKLNKDVTVSIDGKSPETRQLSY